MTFTVEMYQVNLYELIGLVIGSLVLKNDVREKGMTGHVIRRDWLTPNEKKISF
jgi:hypothetical protein